MGAFQSGRRMAASPLFGGADSCESTKGPSNERPLLGDGRGPAGPMT